MTPARMKLSRTSVGLAVRAARAAARLTLKDLAGLTGIVLSTLSRTENGERDLAWTELLLVAEAVKIDPSRLHDLARNIEEKGAAEKQSQRNRLAEDLLELERLGIEAAIEARALSGASGS
jgi:transcriptional regulator with XRE-family HTH domain